MSDVIIIDEPDDSISIIDLVPEVVTVTESGDSTSIVEVLSEAPIVTVVTEKSPHLLMVTSGGSVYQTAVDEGFVGTELEWLSGLFEEYAKVSYVVGAIKTSEDATAYVIQELTAEFANSYVNNESFDFVIANEREAIAISLAALNSKFEDDIAATASQLNTTIANGDLALAERITLTQANLENNYATIMVLNQSIATEQEARALALSELSVNFENRLNASVNSLTEVIADETNARAAAITQLSADYFAGIEAAITQINAVSADIEGTTEAISSLEGAVFNPFTGLSASFTLAQSAKTTADGNASAIAGLRVAVAGSNNQSAAELQLSATVNQANQAFARAFLGVTSTVGGVAKITGITVNGANNALDFAGDIFRLSNTAGAVQLYWSAGTGKWTFTGDIVAGTFQTATSGIRAEMSGVGSFPFWFGSGAKNAQNALMYLDTAGNIFLKNAKLNFIGSNAMRIESVTPFGPHSLISWFGLKVNGVNWDAGTNQPIESGLLKSNARMYIDVNANVFFGGTFQAGTLSSARSTTLLVSNPSIELNFSSNGGLLLMTCSFTYSSYSIGPVPTNPSSAICPASPVLPVIVGTMFLEKFNGTAWIILDQKPISGSYNCTNGEYTAEGSGFGYYANTESNGVFTFTDVWGSGAARYRARASLANWIANANTFQALSITSQE